MPGETSGVSGTGGQEGGPLHRRQGEGGSSMRSVGCVPSKTLDEHESHQRFPVFYLPVSTIVITSDHFRVCTSMNSSFSRRCFRFFSSWARKR